jgi:release factor glutamine methyltransferase
MPVYPPREDSFLLEKYVKKLASGAVLDVGTGSGIQAVAAARKKSVRKVVSVDIDAGAIEHCKRKIVSRKITFLLSDLFSSVHVKFDTIVFNPPYLPEDERDGADFKALSGGRKGYELIARFLDGVGGYLKDNGQILLIFSSLTGKAVVDRLIEEHGFVGEVLETQKFFMEELYCYRLVWNPAIVAVRRKGVHDPAYFARGKRGLIFVGMLGKTKVAVKLKRVGSLALGRIENEAKWLKKFNKFWIGPKLLFAGHGFLVYEFVPGEFILDFIKLETKKNILPVIKATLDQCFVLDELGIAKEEMHHPVKHVRV